MKPKAYQDLTQKSGLLLIKIPINIINEYILLISSRNTADLIYKSHSFVLSKISMHCQNESEITFHVYKCLKA